MAYFHDTTSSSLLVVVFTVVSTTSSASSGLHLGNHGLYLHNTKSFIHYLLFDSPERDLRFLPFQPSYPSAVAHSDVPHMLFNAVLFLSFVILVSMGSSEMSYDAIYANGRQDIVLDYVHRAETRPTSCLYTLSMMVWKSSQDRMNEWLFLLLFQPTHFSCGLVVVCVGDHISCIIISRAVNHSSCS